MTAWNPNIPNPNDVPASDATAMQANNAVIDSAWKVDHVNLSLLSQQGFHKQLSLSNVGSSPYTVAGLQSYGYSKSLASNTRTYLEYQPAGGEVFAANPAVVPLSFKAYVVFDTTGVGIGMTVPLANYKRLFNVSSIVHTSNSKWTVTFNENMPDAFYTTFVSFVGDNSGFAFSQTANILVVSFTPFSATTVSITVM